MTYTELDVYDHALLVGQRKFNEANNLPLDDINCLQLDVYYQAGKMSGLPRFGFDIFDKAARDLRKRGIFIVSPAELDNDTQRKAALESKDGNEARILGDNTRAFFLKRDFQIVLEAAGIIALPNWYDSEGARDECRIAQSLGKPVFLYDSECPELLDLAPSLKVV